ncbi:MAG: NAD(P)H-quinone oxidoreductase subunit N [Prochlorotrichaceae cyanobacterium]|jgi:NAD(P)H-quinone oxidoreductase subunit N
MFTSLLITGNQFLSDLKAHGALALYAPLEGGFEGRYQRRLRTKGYEMVHLSARGIGDLSMYLTGVHGVRPPHLGKKNIGQEAAVGPIYYIPPILQYHLVSLPPKAAGVVLWLIEGNILSDQELDYLIGLPNQDSRLKVVIEMGGDRQVSWKPLRQLVSAA